MENFANSDLRWVGRLVGCSVGELHLIVGSFHRKIGRLSVLNLTSRCFCFVLDPLPQILVYFLAIVLKGDSTVAHSNCCKQVLPHFGWKLSCRFLSMSEEKHMTTFHLNSSDSTYTHDAASCSSRGFCDMNHSENPKPCSFNFWMHPNWRRS